MDQPTQFVVASQQWLKALIVLATVAATAFVIFMIGAGFRTNEGIAWITVVAVASGAAWVVAVGIDHMRFFKVALLVQEGYITVVKGKARRTYPFDQLNLRTRPVANTVELRHPKDGRVFLADMYAQNVFRLVQLFEERAPQ